MQGSMAEFIFSLQRKPGRSSIERELQTVYTPVCVWNVLPKGLGNPQMVMVWSYSVYGVSDPSDYWTVKTLDLNSYLAHLIHYLIFSYGFLFLLFLFLLPLSSSPSSPLLLFLLLFFFLFYGKSILCFEILFLWTGPGLSIECFKGSFLPNMLCFFFSCSCHF